MDHAGDSEPLLTAADGTEGPAPALRIMLDSAILRWPVDVDEEVEEEEFGGDLAFREGEVIHMSTSAVASTLFCSIIKLPVGVVFVVVEMVAKVTLSCSSP